MSVVNLPGKRVAVWVGSGVLACATAAFGAKGTPSDGPAPGTTPVDKAIARGLTFLARTQQKDGSWQGPSYRHHSAITSLPVMAFLASGHTPVSGAHRQAVEKGVRYVLASAQPNGLLTRGGGQTMYSHGTSTLMLAEVVGMCPPKLVTEVREKLGKAVRLIIDAQNLPKSARDNGGWRYQPTSRDADISCTGWQLMALRAAKNVGCDVPKENIDRAVAYLKRCSHRGGGFGYQPGGGPNAPRTGTGMLGLEICGVHHSPEALRGGDWLMRQPLRYGGGFFFYGIYYCSQGMFQLGGKYWNYYRPRLQKVMLGNQQRDGSWQGRGGHERRAGPGYCTGMAILALTVEYRYLPIYQR